MAVLSLSVSLPCPTRYLQQVCALRLELIQRIQRGNHLGAKCVLLLHTYIAAIVGGALSTVRATLAQGQEAKGHKTGSNDESTK